LQLERYSLGSIIQYLGVIDARSVLIPRWQDACQRYIGNKVRQAERLRACAKHMRLQVMEIFSDFYLELPEGNPVNRVKPDSLLDSINANAYMRRFLVADSRVRCYSHVTLRDLSSTVADGPFGSNLKVEDYVTIERGFAPVIRVKDCFDGELQTDDLVWIKRDKQEELARSEVKPGDLLITKYGRIGSAAVHPDDMPNANITSHLVRARIKSVCPWYIAYFLETEVGRLITERHSFKSTRPELTKTEIEECPIPLIGDEQINLVSELAQQRYAANVNARALTTAAKLLVEAIIEGQLTEADLIAAQQALEAGDDNADRAILARLKTDGLDGSGTPLFPDLDRLAALLERAESEAAGDAR
jgi:type I restriction enzyme S subunit